MMDYITDINTEDYTTDIITKYGIAKEMGYGEAYASSKTSYVGWHCENNEEYCIWKHNGQLYHQLQKYKVSKNKIK